jgi:hypothetical protein
MVRRSNLGESGACRRRTTVAVVVVVDGLSMLLRVVESAAVARFPVTDGSKAERHHCKIQNKSTYSTPPVNDLCTRKEWQQKLVACEQRCCSCSGGRFCQSWHKRTGGEGSDEGSKGRGGDAQKGSRTLV